MLWSWWVHDPYRKGQGGIPSKRSVLEASSINKITSVICFSWTVSPPNSPCSASQTPHSNKPQGVKPIQIRSQVYLRTLAETRSLMEPFKCKAFHLFNLTCPTHRPHTPICHPPHRPGYRWLLQAVLGGIGPVGPHRAIPLHSRGAKPAKRGGTPSRGRSRTG